MPHVNHLAGSPCLPEGYGLSTISYPDLEDSEETRTFFWEGFVSLCPRKLDDRFVLACWHCCRAEGSQRISLLPGRQMG